jgi:hypothetical protein
MIRSRRQLLLGITSFVPLTLGPILITACQREEEEGEVVLQVSETGDFSSETGWVLYPPPPLESM